MAANTSWMVEVAFASQPDAANPVWTDVTAYVDTVNTPIEIVGGDTAEDVDQGRMSLQLNNSDQRFTPGNVNSPYYPNVKSGRKIRVREYVGATLIDLFTGYIEFPEITAWTASTSSAPRDQVITITAVDRLTRLANGRPFISTLAEFNLYQGGTALQAYYPLGESTGATSALNVASTARAPLYAVWNTAVPGSGAVPLPVRGTDADLFSFGTGPSLPGDDIPSITASNSSTGSSYSQAGYLQASFSPNLTQASGETISLVFWCTPSAVAEGDTPITIRNNDDISLQQDMVLYYLGGQWTVRWGQASPPTTASVAGPPIGKPTLIAIRFTTTSGLLEYWQDANTPVTGTLGGSIPTSLTWTSLAVGYNNGSAGHVQVYIGAGAYTYTQHLAQFQMGLYGMEQQLTGDRIRAIAAYAGLPAGELTQIDDGIAVMSRASLAGKDPLAAMAEAVDTEQGQLYADGSGNLVFADRRRLYNV